MKKRLSIFIAIIMLMSSSAYATSYYFFENMAGLINAPAIPPFNGGSSSSGGDALITIDDVVFNVSTETKTLGLTISGLDVQDMSNAQIVNNLSSITTDLITNISNVDDGDEDDSTRDVKFDRLLVGPSGQVEIRFDAMLNGVSVGWRKIDVFVATSCDDPINTTDVTDPTGTGHTILCDADQNYLIASVEDLLHISHNQTTTGIDKLITSGNYKLTSDISFGSPTTVDWDGDGVADATDPEGWMPLGYDYYFNNGSFDGGEHSISNFYINRSSGTQGLFSYSEALSISNLNMLDVDITAGSGSGALVGEGYELSFESVTVSGEVSLGGSSGGLIGGWSSGVTIDNCTVSANISGSSSLGGMAYYLDTSSITNSHMTGDVTGTGSTIAGIVAEVGGVEITDSSNTGSVSGASNIGGLVGYGYSTTISSSFSSGDVTGSGSDIGGIFGFIDGDVTIINSYASGNVSGTDNVGGIGGGVYYETDIVSSYASGNVTGSGSNIGGLVGYTEWDVDITNSYATGSVSGSSNIGGLMGADISEESEVNNAGDKCVYVNEGSPTTACDASLAIAIKTDFANGIWDDGTWENLEDLHPKLEWENPDEDYASNIEAPHPAACNSWDPFDGMDKQSNVYLLGNSEGDSAIAQQQLLCISQMNTASALSKNFKLMVNITFSTDEKTVDWDGDGSADGIDTEGFKPWGSSLAKFTGGFDGNGKTISNLYIDRSSEYQGLFGYTNGANIENLNLVDVDITAGNNSGGVIGYATSSTIDGINVSGEIGGALYYLGGLIGKSYNSVTINDSHVSANVSGSGVSRYIGGLMGYDYNTMTTNSSVTGDVSGDNHMGGLVGYGNRSKIYRCKITGDVNGVGMRVGGLIGYSSSSEIYDSYVEGNVTGGNSTGGLVGSGSADVTNSYVTGNVTGLAEVGGVFGYPSNGKIISNSYATGVVSGNSYIGGLYGKTYDVKVNNQSGACEYTGGNITPCSESDAEIIRAGWSYGIWDDDVWENLTAYEPKLEWEDPSGTVTGAIQIDFPAACNSWDPFDGLAKDGSTYLISTADELLCLAQLQVLEPGIVSEDYRLTADIAFGASGAVDWDGDGTIGSGGDSAGFMSLGNNDNKFTGDFDGNNKTITNLYINQSTNSYQGLIGYADGSEIKDIGMIAVNIKGYSYVGGLIGYANASTVTNSYTTGGIYTSVNNNSNIGGLIGRAYSSTTIDYCSSSVIISAGGTNSAGSSGGLVGYLGTSSINHSYATGNVAGKNSGLGGLVGQSYNGTISNSYATGNIIGSSSAAYGGGLVGISNNLVIDTCYATGNVSVGSTRNYAGGFAGKLSGGSITNSYSTGNATAKDYVGGFIGYQSSGDAVNSYSTGTVSGNSGWYIGSFAGMFSGGTITNSYAYWSVAPSGGTYAGGLVGKKTGGTISNEGGLCDSEGGSYECGSTEPSALTNIETIQTGAIYGPWSSSVWSSVGVGGSPTPTHQ